MEKTYVMLGWFSIPTEDVISFIDYLSGYGNVFLGLVRFFRKNKEQITKTRPLYGWERKGVFDNLGIKTFYWDFYSPYIRYVTNPFSMMLQIKRKIPRESVFVAREPSHAIVYELFFKIHGFGVETWERTGTAGTDVRDKIYQEIKEGVKTNWESYVTKETRDVIKENWARLVALTNSSDYTWRFSFPKLFDFKIPLEGLLFE